MSITVGFLTECKRSYYLQNSVIQDGCSKNIVGEGSVQTQERPLAPFTKTNHQSTVTSVVIQTGPVQQVTIKAQENILPLIKTEVRGDELFIFHPDNTCYSSKEPLLIEIVVPHFIQLVAKGTSKIQATGIKENQFTLDSSGTENIDLSGEVFTLQVNTKGTGTLHLDSLRAQTLDIEDSGTGICTLCVTETLKAIYSGTGPLEVMCSPKQLSVEAKGTGLFSATKLQATKGDFTFTGTGQATLTGTIQSSSFKLDGTTHLDARNLKAERAVLHASGTGSAEICVTQDLQGESKGTGNINIYCHPKTTSFTKGTLGSVEYP